MHARQRPLSVLFIALMALSLVGCGSDTSPGEEGADGRTDGADGRTDSAGDVTDGAGDVTDGAGDVIAPSRVTYHGEIRALMEQHCVGCHSEGGIGPFALAYEPGEWLEGGAWWAPLASSAVTSQYMPPWMPDDACMTYEHSRALPAETRDLFFAWAAAGYPEGDPSAYAAPEVERVELGAPDLSLDAGVAYTPNRDRPDDYHCLPLAHTFAEDTFVTAVDVLPDQRELVHHVLLYLVEPEEVGRLTSLDEGEAGPGYTCYGGPLAGNGRTLAGWVPGQQPSVMPDEAAAIIPAGSRVVMQLHYNTSAWPGDEALPEDRTEVSLWTLPAGEAPRYEINTIPFPHAGIQIEAGDPESVHTRDFTLPFNADIIGFIPHMHTLGSSIRLEHVSGGEAACLVHIPEWDFNWQQTYFLAPEDFVRVSIGDVHRLTCVYDNSAENQPVVNGEQQTPRDVTWGEGTFDEMCLSYLLLRSPYNSDGSRCGGFDACYADCPEGDGACFLDCSLQSGGECAQCLPGAVGDCTSSRGVCVTQGVALVGCFESCSGDQLTCAQGECAEAVDVYFGCMDPYLRDGTCNEQLDACGVTL